MEREKRYSDSDSATTVKIEVSVPLGSEVKRCTRATDTSLSTIRDTWENYVGMCRAWKWRIAVENKCNNPECLPGSRESGILTLIDAPLYS